MALSDKTKKELAAELRSLRGRARNVGSKLAHGAKGTAIGALAGGLASIAHMKAAQNISFLANNGVVAPVLMIVGGHFLKRKMPDAGTALIGAGAYAAGQWWLTRPSAQAAQSQAETQGLQMPAGQAAPSMFTGYTVPVNQLDVPVQQVSYEPSAVLSLEN